MTRKPKAPIVGNKSTKRFHTTRRNNDSCRVAEIKPSNRVPFHTEEEATEAGYVACKLCCVKAG